MLYTAGVSISRHTHIRVLLLLVNMRTTTQEYDTAKRGSSFMSGLPRDPDVKFQHPPLILTKTKTKEQCGSSLSVNTNQFSTKAILHLSILASKIEFFNNFRNKRISKIQAIKIQENIPFRLKAPVPQQQQLLPRIKTFQIKTAAQLLQNKHPIAPAMILDKIKQLEKNLSQTQAPVPRTDSSLNNSGTR